MNKTATESTASASPFYRCRWQVSSRGLGLLTLFLFVSSARCSLADFAQANQEFAAGHFQEAVRDYQAVVDKGEYSPPLFYNLGNAYFRVHDFGRAILNYERALALDPRQPEAEANLRIAREQARALELQPTKLERFARSMGANRLTIIGAIAGWGFLFCLTTWLFSRRRSARGLALSVLCLTIFGAAGVGVYATETGPHGSDLAIITGKDVDARVATADNANRVLALPAGSEVQIVSQRGDWIYATLPNQLRGWIPGGNTERVRL